VTTARARRRARSLAAVALTTAVALAGCGGGGDDAGSRGGPGERGGSLTVLASGDFLSLDPGSAYYSLDYMVVYAVHRPLYSFAPSTATRPSPDLAAGPPRVTDGGRTITVRLRPGVRFGPPVDRAVTSADVRYAIERAFTARVANPYVGTHFAVLRGAPPPGQAQTPRIAGIQTPDARTIVFRLTRPSGTFMRALTLPVTAPVPRDYAQRYDRGATSSYAMHQVATGPYMISADGSGKLSYAVGRGLTLVRNPAWDPTSDRRPAKLDRIRFSVGNEDTGVASRRIFAGQHMIGSDFAPDPAQLRDAIRNRPRQIRFVELGSQYVALNTTVKPLDDLDVRRAILAAVDRTALQLAGGGAAAGHVASHFLPPAVPGYLAAGGARGTGDDFLAKPGGDPELARSYLRRAGFASGRYTGGKRLLMVGESSGVGRATAELVERRLEGLGFDVDLRIVSREIMYSRYCNVPAARVAVCPNVGWIPDFADGQAMLDAPFNGDSIVPESNVNWPQLDVPSINAAMVRARSIIQPGPRARAWAAIDRAITAQAAAVPYLWNRVPAIRSADVDGEVDRWSGVWDLSYMSVR
jgi:peptide/nickel transport system substrate-binding protein